MDMKQRYLTAAVVALIVGGASESQIFDQFIKEKEGNFTTAYQDAGGIWTVCQGVTRIDGRPVKPREKLTEAQCARLNAIERDKAIAWVKKHVPVSLTPPQIAGIASFCPYNIGAGKCFSSTFYRKLQAGDIERACKEIPRWVFDGGKDCRKTQGQPGGCYGQVIRRNQEAELLCWELMQVNTAGATP
ncbi:lysozyme [Providencia sp. PROV130]|uniref:lysozyme n=1 Tax=Providencia sp. PROV130 TaxID=2949840 RepID=UPI00234BEACB|nr:lysozyme [Providencia sp. PROV130]